jgi:predicted transcriptional regulator
MNIRTCTRILGAKTDSLPMHPGYCPQMQAAELLGIAQPKLSNMLRGQFGGISETKMIECLTRLGRNIEIVIKGAPRSKVAGRVSVVFA